MSQPAVSAAASVGDAPARIDPAIHTAGFFDALLDAAPTDHHTLLWTLQDKFSTWVPLDAGIDPVSEAARGLADAGRDVYVAVSLAAAPGLTDTRIRTDNSAGIMGLWADIDIADPDIHKKWNLPPSEAAALELLDDAQLKPTLVVHSGHGLQAWWLFNEFWAFDGEQARLEAYGLAQRWNSTLQARAAVKSWVVDSTFDLARVMRVPGTLNRKGSPVMPVKLIVGDGPRYNPDDFDAYLVDENYAQSKGVVPSRRYQPDPLNYTQPPPDPSLAKFEALRDNHDKFGPTWAMKRKDFTDQSPSSYDLSLMTYAVAAGWSDAELHSLVYRFRVQNRLDTTKAMRKDYIERTIAKARDKAARKESFDVLDELGDALLDAKATGDEEQVRPVRRAALDALSTMISIECLHFLRFLSEPEAFAVVTPTKTVMLGQADGILQQTKFRQSIWQTLGHQIDRFKTPDWDRFTDLVTKAWEDQDVGAEATSAGQLAAWLTSYLGQRPPLDSLEEAFRGEYPFMVDGRIALFGAALKRWLYLTYQERISVPALGVRLKAFGCEPVRVWHTPKGEKRQGASYWVLPERWTA